MIFGKTRRPVCDGRRLLLFLLLWAPLPAFAFSLADLKSTLASVQQAKAHFVEERQITVLDVPLTSSGMLSYRAPDFLQKSVVAPRPGRFTIDGDTLTIEEGGKERHLNLSMVPQLKVFTESFRAVLAGDFDSLARLYHLTLGGDHNRWTLLMEPRSAPLTGLVEAVTVVGSGPDLQRFDVRERSGDRSSMTMEVKCRDADC